jgi:hypothetical protein
MDIFIPFPLAYKTKLGKLGYCGVKILLYIQSSYLILFIK